MWLIKFLKASEHHRIAYVIRYGLIVGHLSYLWDLPFAAINYRRIMTQYDRSLRK